MSRCSAVCMCGVVVLLFDFQKLRLLISGFILLDCSVLHDIMKYLPFYYSLPVSNEWHFVFCI